MELCLNKHEVEFVLPFSTLWVRGNWKIVFVSIRVENLTQIISYNKINGAIWRHFGKQMNKETKLRIHIVTAKAALKLGSEAWVLKKREEQRLEAAQMRFLRHLLGITKLYKEKNQCIRQKREHRQ